MPRPNTKKRTAIRWTKRILLIAGAAGVIALIVRALIPQPVGVDLAVATRGPLDVEVREDGQTRVRDRFVITAPITGELERVAVDPGSYVDAGAVISRISPPRPALLDDRTRSETVARLAGARAHERQAVSAIARAEGARALAATEAERTRTLVAKGAIPGGELDRAETTERLATEDLAAATHLRAAAAAEIEALRAVLTPRDAPVTSFAVTAPTRGRVLRVIRESAGPVVAGTPLVEIGDPASLEVVVDVLSRDAERIAPGMNVELETSKEQPIRGVVSVVEPSAFTRISALGVEEQRVNIIVCFDGLPALGDAFRVDARIIVWHGDAILHIPASALFRDRGTWAVYVVSGGRAHLRSVEVGHRGRTDVEITKGVREADRVILHPGDTIHDATRVAPNEE